MVLQATTSTIHTNLCIRSGKNEAAALEQMLWGQLKWLTKTQPKLHKNLRDAYCNGDLEGIINVNGDVLKKLLFDSSLENNYLENLSLDFKQMAEKYCRVGTKKLFSPDVMRCLNIYVNIVETHVRQHQE